MLISIGIKSGIDDQSSLTDKEKFLEGNGTNNINCVSANF